MPESATELHRSILAPARVLIGSLIAGAGLAVLGFFAGGSAASAAESAPSPAPVTALVSQTVAPVLPAPVQNVISAVVTPVTDTVDQVVEQVPVSSVVSPVAVTVDQVVAAVPVVRDVLPPAPASSILQPVTGAIDQAVSDAVGAVDTAVAPLAPATEVGSVGPSDSLDVPGAVALSASAGASALVAAALSCELRGLSTFSSGPVALGGILSTAPVSPLGGEPIVPPLDVPGGLPSDGSPGASGGSSGSGGAAPSAVATADSFLLPVSAWSGLSGAAADDHVPAGPVADHDISPD